MGTSVQNWLLRGAEQPLTWSSWVSQHGGICGETPDNKGRSSGDLQRHRAWQKFEVVS